jgi:hypothetical protein
MFPSRDFRERGDDIGRFVGQELDRLVTTARLIGATGPTDFDAMRDQADMIAREAWEARGYEAGYAEGLADGTLDAGALD